MANPKRPATPDPVARMESGMESAIVPDAPPGLASGLQTPPPVIAPGHVAVVAQVPLVHDDRPYFPGDVFVVNEAAAARLLASGAADDV